MVIPAELPAVYILAAGITLLSMGYLMGRVIQSIEDGLLLIGIRIAGYLVIIYFFLRALFGITLF